LPLLLLLLLLLQSSGCLKGLGAAVRMRTRAVMMETTMMLLAAVAAVRGSKRRRKALTVRAGGEGGRGACRAKFAVGVVMSLAADCCGS
jgi:hypothetical protein